MKRRPRWIEAGAVVAAVFTSACTLIGYGIGKAIEGKPKQVAVPRIEMLRLKPGQQVTLFFHDGTERAGKFEGVAPASPEYSKRWRLARESQGESALPQLGQEVELESPDGKTSALILTGFDPGVVLLRPAAAVEPRTLPHDHVARLAREEGSVDETALVSLMVAGQIPCRSRLIVDSENVLLESVQRIEVKRSGNAVAIGTAIGAVVDVAVLVAAIAYASDDSWSSGGDTTTTNSCPFVYTWDGRIYRREAEMYGGAILPSLARTDEAPLVHLQPVDGRLRLRVSNEQSEIEFLDRLALLELDLPEGARVATSPAGGLLVLRSPVPPTSARDRRQRDVLSLLAQDDGEEWTSDPLGLDPEREGPRDLLEVEFERPAGARQVALDFTLRSTPWGAALLGSVLRLQGRDLHVFYARLEAAAAERERFLTALAREGLPRIEVWDGQKWQVSGYLRNLGPVTREQALVVDVPEGTGGRLKVRLSATAGLWRIDRVAADFGPVAAPTGRELPLVSARTRRGQSVHELVNHVDGREVVMPPWSAVVELEFAPSPQPGGARRAYAVRATGHYRILVKAVGDPDRRTFDRLLAEPGEFGRWALAGLRREMMMRAGDVVAAAP
jgi:hypothetical protein